MMKKGIKTFLTISLSFILLLTISAFIISEPKPDFNIKNTKQIEAISISKIETENTALGSFKSVMNFQQSSTRNTNKEFYGQEIRIKDNSNIDQILIGICNNLISRIEVLNKGKLIETKELGFMNKMTWGEIQTMNIIFYDQRDSKHQGKSKITMRFYSGTGFLGDIGTINLDLTKYGDVSGDKTISIFSKPLDIETIKSEPEFSNLSIWKNYQSFD
ncbi:MULTISPECIES: hypothetical protein [unclassified Lentimicrobium]|uniref:hypothetical protein n=1 Tax=unclassified Lentimicrobium TaxID=2677434 RepID=UPI0015519900|nr:MULTISPECIES: hypothetical protein [unclassified Lentimicrobium]NPD48096.1 hypothetical protein [Lentimicrobium sp. S6]NPD85072.1 hypothetical protein [Lentimicrobium sp. L6]